MRAKSKESEESRQETPKITADSTELTAWLVNDIRCHGCRVVGVDGRDGSGKTTLAKHLATQIRCPLIELDDFIVPNWDGSGERLRYGDLKAALGGTKRPLVLEGVCLLDAVRRIDLPVDRLVYVKELSIDRIWVDQEECDFDEPADAVLERTRELAKLMGEALGEEEVSGEPSPFREEVIRYHASFRPARRADYLFERTRSSE